MSSTQNIKQRDTKDVLQKLKSHDLSLNSFNFIYNWLQLTMTSWKTEEMRVVKLKLKPKTWNMFMAYNDGAY